ncbi:MFS transporter [Meiothermus granaticius]|uniref:Multidrug efflux pump Tap n=1 Tax=Meiothermus granaticius NBRC 107808 TaxID=1227551 RepID=A0A399F717_9DEIN|nr:MFS transporter [Meiothermus granaticius]RIH92454.1 Enterobactin exporter EntS [Meiothermus granaticius NBRC 107808]GEM87152.1 MFS transporter [Meiothermus granaticius NBRC 107808]
MLSNPEFRLMLLSSAASTLAGAMLAVVIGYRVYERTHNPLSLGILGLVEAIPALSFALLGGHLADRFDRRGILLATRGIALLGALGLAGLSSSTGLALVAVYVVVFVTGLARGFADPASGALEAMVVPRVQLARASTYFSSAGQACAILGPALGGLLYGTLGARGAFGIAAVFYAIATVSVGMIRPKAPPLPQAQGESVWQSIRAGYRYVFGQQVLWASMALDLFAVLFGGAIALLPAFANDLLKVGPQGLGLMAAAPSVGALVAMLIAARYPPLRHAGRWLLASVAGFGVSIIVFGFSQSFILSLAMLALSGGFDGVSMVVRRLILRLRSPDAMRGRIAAVSSIFIGASNEIGAFESGMAASLLGVRRAVWAGGLVTLGVVALVANAAPILRGLNLLESHWPEADRRAELEAL